MVTVYTNQGVTIWNIVVQYSVPAVLQRSVLTVAWEETWLGTAAEAKPKLKELKLLFSSRKRMTKMLTRKLCHSI